MSTTFSMKIKREKLVQLKVVSLVTLSLAFLLSTCADDQVKTSDNLPKDTIKTAKNQELHKLIQEKDSLLFQIGFNQIDTLQVAELISQDFEFYHDEHGVTNTKRSFINSINSLRDLPFKTWRSLVEGSMEVFPLYKDNSLVLYGAIQNGIHEFYQQNEGERANKTSIARFTHLWIIENGDWKLKRVLSYDHQVAK